MSLGRSPQRPLGPEEARLYRSRQLSVLVLGLLATLALPSCGAERRTALVRGDSLLTKPLTTPAPVCEDPYAATNACLSCHEGIEFIRCSDTQMFQEIIMTAEASGSNNQCIVCHGGNPDVIRPKDLERESEAYKALTEQAHSGTTPYFEANPGPKDFYPDPGSPWINKHSCGVCHEWEVRVQWQSLMMTEAGKIQGTVWGFGGQTRYEHRWANYDVKDPSSWNEIVGTETFRDYLKQLSIKEPQVFVEKMEQLPAAPEGGEDVELDPKLAAFTYIRGECQRCHLGVGGMQRHGDYRGMGCSACHIPYANSGLYEGGDEALQGASAGRPLIHSIQSGVGATCSHGETTWRGIPVETCTTCHNRGRRIGVSYQGLMETPYEGPYSPHGKPQQKLHGKTYIQLHADLHKDKGFLCQDCHTTLDVHGSGKLVGSIAGAVEIECQDCHGTPQKYPWELPLGYSDEYEEKAKTGPARGTTQDIPEFMEKGDYPEPGDGYLLTTRGNPFGNVVRRGDKLHVHLASGAVRELYPLKLLNEQDMLSTEARLAMCQVGKHMDRMECYTCHSTWAPQCYGCHIKIDYTEDDAHYDWVALGMDHQANGLTSEFTPHGDTHKIRGKITETRSFLRWEDPALAQNGEGRISPVIPGCQTTVTVVGKDGKTVIASKIFRIGHAEGAGEEGQLGIDHSPLHPHTVQKRARTCESCHASKKALGYGIDGGVHYADPSQDHYVDLETADGRMIPRGATPQMSAIPGLENDWSRFVTEDGKQLQTVGHHFKLSRPLNNEERANMAREGICLACHQEIPDESVAVNMLHHIGEFAGMLPTNNEEHSDLVHKTTMLAAWVQVAGGFAGGMFGLAVLIWWRRRRRAKQAA
jgi:hypothetical protein